jgi:hypothetical protein
MTATGPQRIMASAPRWRRMGLAFALIYGGLFALLGGVLALAHALLDAQALRSATGPIVIAGALAALGAMIYGMAPRPLPLDLWPDRLIVDEGRRGVFPLTGMQLGAWMMPGHGVRRGSALHLVYGPHRFCLGGLDHRLRAEMTAAGDVETVDAFVTAGELDAILARCAAFLPLLSAERPSVVRCALVPHRGSILPWRAPTATLVLELEPTGLRLLDARSGALLAAAGDTEVQVSPTKHTFHGRATITWIGLIVQLAGSRPIHIGVPDPRFAWRGDVGEHEAAEFFVGNGDWLALVDRLGLTPHLHVDPM